VNKINIIKQYKIGVLAGGCSSEREISLKSGRGVFDALTELGLNVVFIDIRKEDESFLSGVDIDVAFIALHGKFGEDGRVQRILSGKGVLYGGSGPDASRIAMDKIASKEIFKKNGLKVADHILIGKNDRMSSGNIGFPCVVKPQYEGSSIGLTVVQEEACFREAVDKAMEYEGSVLVEKYIDGREITVGILNNEALPVIEIIPDGGVYDYNAKYKSANTRYVRLDDAKIAERAQKAALSAHLSLGCENFSRVDFRVNAEGELFILEVNTIPGMTERSLLPMAARLAGIDFPELCLKILSSAVSRAAVPCAGRT